MLFNSYLFLFAFLPVTLAGLYLLSGLRFHRTAITWTGLASLVFYSAWEPKHLLVLLGSVLINFYLGRGITAAMSIPVRRVLTICGVILNLGLLFVYKYLGFAAQNLSLLFHMPLDVVQWVMPIGISFFTFTQISYLVDAYKNKIHRYRFEEYLLFVSFFPHLVAGPILRHHAIMPQLQNARFGRPSARFAYIGLAFFCVGLFKKVMIADNLAPFVTQLYDNTANLSLVEGWCAALLYTLQLYYDFSGYSEMAMGLAFMLNVKIPLNFNSPYRSRSMIEFWRRWHISLSIFLRDYVYIPLGGSRCGKARQFANLFITMALCGLWHGAGWTFVVWGAWHGALLIGNHLWRKLHIAMPAVVGWAITFLCFTIGWVCFRAHDMTSTFQILSAMFDVQGSALKTSSLLNGDALHHVLAALLFLVPWVALAPNARYFILRRKPAILFMIAFAYMAILGIINMSNPTQFLYFQF